MARPSAAGCPGTGAGAARCRTPQHKTTLIDVRSVRYPFHPWFGQEVYVLAQGRRHGQAVLDCRVDLDNARTLEVPAWMFDDAACVAAAVTSQPRVCFQALRRLRRLLDTGPCPPATVDDQHPCPPSKGDADGSEPAAPTPCSPDTASAGPADLGGTAPDGPAAGDPTPGPDASGLPRPATRRRNPRGGRS